MVNMFCSQCGKSFVRNTKLCHNCGNSCSGSASSLTSAVPLSQQQGTVDTSSSNTQSTQRPLTFAQFRAQKECDRNKHFKGKSVKRLKAQDTSGKSSDVKINIGIMTKREDTLVIKRGVALPLTVLTAVNYNVLLKKSVEKHHRFNKDLVKHDSETFYHLLYNDKKRATMLPGSDEPFTLKRYKEEIDKAYSRISLYLCTVSDYMSSIFNDLLHSDSDSEFDESDGIQMKDETEVENTTHYISPAVIAESQPTTSEVLSIHPTVKDATPACRNPVMTQSQCTSSEFASGSLNNEEKAHALKEAQCPLCYLMFLLDAIDVHANTCSDFFKVNSNEQIEELPGDQNEEWNAIDQTYVPSAVSRKSMLKGQIKTHSTKLSTELTRINVRRRFLLEDFKNARKRKINPLSNLKITFVGEPSIDDGGPKREFFCGKYLFFSFIAFFTFVD